MRRALLSMVLVCALGCSESAGDEPSNAFDAKAPDTGAPPIDAADSTAAVDTGEPPPDTSADADAMTTDALVPAEVACAPAPPTCPSAAADRTIRASYRKDSYLPTYAEDGDAPTTGGRFHVAAISEVTGNITKVTIDGVDVSALSTPDLRPSIEWAHVWPKQLRAGEPVTIQFHSRASKWDSATSGTIKIETDAGVALDATFPVAKTGVPITWVTTTTDRKTVLVHAHNRDSSPRTIRKIFVNGRDVTAAACIADKAIAAAATALITVPLCDAWNDGDAFSVALEYDDAATAAAVGRVVTPFHPVEAWNNTGECPFPGGSAANYDAIVTKGGVDTLYTHGGVCSKCGCETYKLINETLPAAKLHTLITDDLPTSLPKLTNLAAVAAISTGDESDGSVFAEVSSTDKRVYSVPAKKAEKSEQLWQLYPSLPTFNGGKTNKNIGTFAGMADVQGMDFYFGACAPHITRFGTDYPLRGPYDYLRNTRENHMPLPTWLYAQGLSPAWHKVVEVGGVKLVDYYADPSPSEILVQAFQVYAAGAKGFLWFQVNQDRAKDNKPAWDAIVRANKITRALRELLREGDPTGAARTTQKALVEAIRSRDAIVVPVIDEEFTSKPTDTACNTAASAGAVPHFKFATQKVTVDVAIPRDLAVVDVFEVTADGVRECTAKASGRTVTLADVALDETTPARVFVLARTKELRSKLYGGL